MLLLGGKIPCTKGRGIQIECSAKFPQNEGESALKIKANIYAGNRMSERADRDSVYIEIFI